MSVSDLRLSYKMSIKNNIQNYTDQVNPFGAHLVAVSKTQPVEKIREAYDAGQRFFGENKVQEMVPKHDALPKDIAWHMIGHLQTNKVKSITPFVSLIHSVDSPRLLDEINKQGKKTGRIIPCLLQVYIADEETKYGFSEEEIFALLTNPGNEYSSVRVTGLMGMASLTDNREKIRQEFRGLKRLFDRLGSSRLPDFATMKELSMGMSSDYHIALEEGSTLIRIGTSIFGERNHPQ
jgi:PLP dependent protein